MIYYIGINSNLLSAFFFLLQARFFFNFYIHIQFVLIWNLYLLLDAWHIIFTYFWHRISIFNLFNSFNILLFDLFLGSLIFEPTCNLFFWNIQLLGQFWQFAVSDDILTETKIIFFQFYDLVWSLDYIRNEIILS